MVLKPLKWALAASVFALLSCPVFAQEAAAPAAEKPAGEAPAATTPEAAPPPVSEKPAEATPAEPEPTPTPTRSSSPAPEIQCFSSLAEITTLREPQFGLSPSVWDIVYSEDGMDVFADFVPVDPKTMVAAGAYTKDKDDQVYHPLLVKYDERYKKVWEVREETKEQRTIHRVLKTKDGFTVLGDMTDSKRGNGIYIASYDDAGKVKGKPAQIYESGGELDAKAFIPAQDGNGYIVAAQFIDSKDQEKQHGLLYKVSNAGKVVWKRSFKPGRSTVFNNIQTAIDGNSYIVTGQIVTDGNQSGGWLLLVDNNGAIKWQGTYPRGVAASLQAAAQTKEGEFILSGKARPTNYTGQGLAAWVLKTDSTGNPLWQRFFRGPYSYEAPDLIVYEDGRASVLINGAGLDADHRSHARLMTFSPQGNIHHLEDFTEGQNSAAHRLVSGMGGERILIGYAQTSFGENQESNEASAAPVYTYDAWILAAPPLDLYEDPCAPKPTMSPILD